MGNVNYFNTGAYANRITDPAHLPDDVLHLVLSFLPIKSAGQTSVLSRRWNHVWSSYPILDFHDIFTGDEVAHHETRARIINTVFARRDEEYNIIQPCLKTSGQLRFDSVERKPIVDDDSCLPRVENLLVKIELSTSEDTSDYWQRQRCELECHSLRSSTRSCGSSSKSTSWLRFPTSYVVASYIRSLHTLALTNVDFLDTCAFGEDLFSGSSFPYLEQLHLMWCSGMSDLKIRCLNLKYVTVCMDKLRSMDISGMKLKRLAVFRCFREHIDGSWVKIFAPNLQDFRWGYNGITDKCLIPSFPTLETSFIHGFLASPTATTKLFNNRVLDLLSCSSQVETLKMKREFFPILSYIYSDKGGLPFSFVKLKNLEIHDAWGHECIPALACLFKSSPIVDTLDITFESLDDNGNENYAKSDTIVNHSLEKHWELHAQHLSSFLSQLKVVTIGFSEDMISENEFTFAKFLLKYGSVLERMAFRYQGCRDFIPLKSRLYDTIASFKDFPKASADVQILARYMEG